MQGAADRQPKSAKVGRSAETASLRTRKTGNRSIERQRAGSFGPLAVAAADDGRSGRTSDVEAAGTAALASQRKQKSAKGSAGMANGANAAKRKRAAILRDATVGSPISTIAVSSRSGGEKVKAIDTLKMAAKSGEGGASAATLPNGYRPSDGEPFMNERQRLYFRNKLIAWKEEIVRQNRETLQGLHEDSAQHADVADRATFETDRALELRARDRQRKLISKIDAALARIEDGSYGYCEETGEPISLKRLDARPIATLSIEAQERHERRERVFRDE
jgi:DnaK suppressor protein